MTRVLGRLLLGAAVVLTAVIACLAFQRLGHFDVVDSCGNAVSAQLPDVNAPGIIEICEVEFRDRRELLGRLLWLLGGLAVSGSALLRADRLWRHPAVPGDRDPRVRR